MNYKEQYAFILYNNVSLYLKGEITKEEIKTFNDSSNLLNINGFCSSSILVQLAYMREVFKDNYELLIMNNILNDGKFSIITNLTDHITFNAAKMKSIYNGIIAYVFMMIDNDFTTIKLMIESDNLWSEITHNSYIFNYIQPIDLFYCSPEVGLIVSDPIMERFFDYCKYSINNDRKKFFDKIKIIVRKIIKNYESMI